MGAKRKYLLIIALAVSIFAYLTGTYMSGRCADVLHSYDELVMKRETALNPLQLAVKKKDLEARKRALTSSLMNRTTRFEESQTGVFDFLSSGAQKTGVRFESLFPVESDSKGQMKEVGFKLTFAADFHRIGYFINQIETGPMLVRLKRLEIRSHSTATRSLEANAEGAAYLLPKKFLK